MNYINVSTSDMKQVNKQYEYDCVARQKWNSRRYKHTFPPNCLGWASVSAIPNHNNWLLKADVWRRANIFL